MGREQEIARLLLEKNVVVINAKKPFTYASGMKSPIYCDNRMLLSYPNARDKIIDTMIKIIVQQATKFDIIAGVATAGIPWASIIADRLEKPLVYIRSAEKEHGKQNQIEGKIEATQRVLIIEDLVSTGGSSLKAVQAVREAGGIVEHCIAVFTYEMKKATQAFEDAKCKVFTTTTFTTLIKEAAVLKKITKEEEEMVLDWNTDPENWTKKHGLEYNGNIS